MAEVLKITLGMIDPVGDSFGAAQATEDSLASEALALDQGITGMLGGDDVDVSPVDFTATDAATTGMDINPAALAAATGIVGAGISDPGLATAVADQDEVWVLLLLLMMGFNVTVGNPCYGSIC